MNQHRDDTAVSPQKSVPVVTGAESSSDERREFTKDLPIDDFFDGRKDTFARLGRVSATHAETWPWNLENEQHGRINELIKNDQLLTAVANGHLTTGDLLAFAAKGARPTSDNLTHAIDSWWQSRIHSPIWKKPEAAPAISFLERRAARRLWKRLQQISAALGLKYEEAQGLFKTEPFSRRTVYTRDYAVIPKELRAVFKMVPQLIFAPQNLDQLKRFLTYVSQNKMSVATRGRGTWALGGALLTKGGAVLEMTAFEKKIEVDANKQTITVSASVDFQEAEETLNRHRLTLCARPSNKYGVIAGFVSVGEPYKGGLGLNAFAFGHIHNTVESIRVVSSSGEERLVANDSPDFSYYFGTNGRFGVITEVTLKARPTPSAHFPVALHFDDSRKAFEFMQKFSVDVKSGRVVFHPVHVEFFGKAYLDQIRKIKSAEVPARAGELISNAQSAKARDTVLLVFDSTSEHQNFVQYVKSAGSAALASDTIATELWDDRFSPMKLRKKGDLLTAEVILPLPKVDGYLRSVTKLATKLGIEILPVAYILNSNEALVLPQYLTDSRLRFQYYRHVSLAPVLARRAIKKFHGRPYGFGIWFAGLSKRALGVKVFRDLKRAKDRFDPARILNPGKITEIRGRFYNIIGKLILHERSIDLLDLALRIYARLKSIQNAKTTLVPDTTLPYVRENLDAHHRCIKCSACMICPLAQVWDKSGDPKLKKDAIYITPRFKMEFMQQHLYDGKKLSQDDVDRFVLCFRCGVAERETVCPISDMLLEVENGGTSACQKKLPTYDDFEALLRKEGYDIDGAIQRYMDILKTHPGVARAMKEVLGNYRVPKNGDLTTLQPKTDFAVYKVDVDRDRCINCGKCGDEHTTSQRGFWDPRSPRQMVSLDDLLREHDGKIPKSWFNDAGGPIPKALKLQGQSNGEYVYFTKPAQIDLGHQHCNGCLYCVIECPVDAIRVTINDYYVNLAGEDFTREDVRRINEEARTGGVPTSGTGSTGLFGGKGFDRYMFDFSVIVRPTRDGIREAIDIGVNLGRKPLFHLFSAKPIGFGGEEANGNGFPRLKTHFNTLDLPTPLLLELPALPGRKQIRLPASGLWRAGDLVSIFARCAHREGTVLILDFFKFIENFDVLHPFASHIGLRLLSEEIDTIQSWRAKTDADRRLESFKRIPLIEFTGSSLRSSAELREMFSPKVVISHLVECETGVGPAGVAERVLELARAGAEIIHLNCHYNSQKGYHDSADVIQACYEKLLAASLHTQVSIIANGIKSPADLGIAMMMGASALVLDRAALVALNHEFPMLEKSGVALPEINADEGVHRLQNLFKSWHKQIQEVLGAFGVRDIRRTVGETGRLIDLRQREHKMRAIVEDEKLRRLAISVNEEKIKEDGDLAHAASWKYSDLSKLIKAVPPPNANLLGDRKSSLESMLSARGDRRWNADVLSATWMMASGSVPSHKVPQIGADFGGGSFDCAKFSTVSFNGKTMSMDSAVEEVDRAIRAGDPQVLAALDAISISAGVINKHRRPECEPYVNHFPIDGADMSLGSIGWKLTLARYLAGATLKRFTGTGEGGFPLEKFERLQKFFPNFSNDELRWLGKQLEHWVATQTATGYFGVNEDTIRRVRKVVLKFAQGAKPGLGGHILGAKVTSQVEDLRGVIAGISVFSPFPFHDVYSIEDVTKMLEWLRTINPDAIVTVKISTPIDVYHVALGLVTGGADEIQIDATAGGTGAAPDIARNRIAMPLEYGLSDVHKFLVEQGERNKVTLVASGGIRSAYDMAKALILGADKVVLGTQEIVAQQCNRCGNCEAPGGCQKGITTTVEQLEEQKEILLNSQWLINTQVSVMQHVMKMMYVWGVKDIRELRGRTDLISEWGWEKIDDRKSKIEDRKAKGEERKAKSEDREKRSVVVSEWDKKKEEPSERDACGVVSFACSKPVPVESIQTACQRMHNRGNGRGGGILGLGGIFAGAFSGTDPLRGEDCYAFQIITLTPENQRHQKMLEIAQRYLRDFDVFDRKGQTVEISNNNLERFRNPRVQKEGRDITFAEAGLAVDPGDMYRFFVRVKKDVLLDFAQKVLDDCRLSEPDRKILANGHPRELLQNLNIAGKWIDYFVKYFDVLTDDYLEAVNPDSKFWEDPEYQDLWRDLEDEFIYRRAFEINQKFYIEPQNRAANPEAFVASMMKDGGIWKLVGYAEQSADYWIVGDAEYVSQKEISNIENGTSNVEVIRTNDDRAVIVYNRGAHIWIGHQRFPTVFSPYSGGSHPFYGRVYEALIHNGDFANYVAMVRFWDQFGGAPQFRTDTEMAAKAYSILKQMGYPQTHIIEAIAPTTGIDLQRLKKANPELAADFESIQKSHVGGSPDGPWFFIIGDQDAVTRDLRIIGLTDTSVLRPSVFVWQQSNNRKWASIGLVGSEEQACRSVMDALYHSGVLASNEPDRVRIVRGGSVEQDSEGDVRGGGSLTYHLRRKSRGEYGFEIADKFGNLLPHETGVHHDLRRPVDFESPQVRAVAKSLFDESGKLQFSYPDEVFEFVKANLRDWEYNTFGWLVEALLSRTVGAFSEDCFSMAIEALTMLRDRMQKIDTASKQRASLIQMINEGLMAAFDATEIINKGVSWRKFHRVTRYCFREISTCADDRQVLVVDASGFPAEGHDSLARTLVGAYEKGWRKFVVYKINGQRYLGVGFGPNTQDLELHLYGSPGQDIGNSLMGGTVHVHADAQNDMAKILHSGTVVVHGLAGNTGVYGAKGGEIFVRDNVGTRWAINSVSSPTGPGLKVVIVGSAMEYLAESLMGGMVLMLGLEWDERGVLRRKYLPFAGNSILAGASAGKVIIYDPDDRVVPTQFANAIDVGFLSEDWIAVYRNLANLVSRAFTNEKWSEQIERWRTLAKYTLKSENWPLAEKQDALDTLLDLLIDVAETATNFDQLTRDSQALKSLIEEGLTGKEWRTLVRQFGQIVRDFDWTEGIELLERMMDWQEVVELLSKADDHFSLGLTADNGWVYLPIDGAKTEIRRADFKVLRPLNQDEKTMRDEQKLADVIFAETALVA
jgi:glutamate synthase domain-containing protein 2/FAD/FMN-containing dehydrogenase/glutamate synthase domain-containing protein 3/glutamate synthase domain-containing protein 1/Fe-S-cluster-containing dehydrogenase component